MYNTFGTPYMRKNVHSSFTDLHLQLLENIYQIHIMHYCSSRACERSEYELPYFIYYVAGTFKALIPFL